ncbi:pentapeptide repeat-containing protein [soil metagenome]
MPTEHVDQDLDAFADPGDTYVDCRLDGIDAGEVDLRGSRFEGCAFSACTLRLASLLDVQFNDCTFVACDLMGVDLTRARWPQFALAEAIRFVECRLDYANLHGLALEGAVFYGCSMIEADLGEAVLREADLRFSDLTGARFTAADLSQADLTGALGYAIHPEHTRLAQTVVSLPEAAVVLQEMGMVVSGPGPRLTAAERLRES